MKGICTRRYFALLWFVNTLWEKRLLHTGGGTFLAIIDILSACEVFIKTGWLAEFMFYTVYTISFSVYFW